MNHLKSKGQKQQICDKLNEFIDNNIEKFMESDELLLAVQKKQEKQRGIE